VSTASTSIWTRRRDDYVKKLQSIYAERQKLNLEAVRFLLPQVSSLPLLTSHSHRFWVSFPSRHFLQFNLNRILQQ